MEVVYVPKQNDREAVLTIVVEPVPPKRTWFVKEGTVVFHNDHYWRMDIHSSYGGSYRSWTRVVWDSVYQRYSQIGRG